MRIVCYKTAVFNNAYGDRYNITPDLVGVQIDDAPQWIADTMYFKWLVSQNLLSIIEGVYTPLQSVDAVVETNHPAEPVAVEVVTSEEPEKKTTRKRKVESGDEA